MNKYFSTLDSVMHRYGPQGSSPAPNLIALDKLLIDALHCDHDARPEGKYIVAVWRKERGIKK